MPDDPATPFNPTGLPQEVTPAPASLPAEPAAPANGLQVDSNAVPVAQPALLAPGPKPTVEYDADTDLMHYAGDGLNADRVLQLAR